MGNKHELANDVAQLVRDIHPGQPFLDLFCGMCSVGGAIAPSGRPVWGNDVEWFASEAARCLITMRREPIEPDRLAAVLEERYKANFGRLSRRFASDLSVEADILGDPDVNRFDRAHSTWKHTGNDERRAAEVARLRRQSGFPYRLFTLSFAWGYVGLRQAIQIDSIRYAIDAAVQRRELTHEHGRWALLSLVQAVSCAASTPGHFAQYLRGTTPRSVSRIVAQRRRDIWSQFLSEASRLQPYGTPRWRSGNRVFRSDALRIWRKLRQLDFRHGVVYADPPYSKEQYSRYYHVLDTLVRYDYPTSVGVGRYRADRFVTPFSLKTRVAEAFEGLCAGVSGTGSALVVSYPSNGLLTAVRPGCLKGMLGEHFATVDVAFSRTTEHSTLGGRHGKATNSVNELVLLALPRNSARRHVTSGAGSQ